VDGLNRNSATLLYCKLRELIAARLAEESPFDMEFLAGVLRDDLVHEAEEFDAPSSFKVPPRYLPGGDVEGGKQRGRAVPPLVVRLTDHRLPI
jgi:hypothetical protein